MTETGERIAKVMAARGLCSRREAERWIEAGRVSVNGEALTTPARTVTAADVVLVDGKPMPAMEPARLWRYHKPRGLITSHADPQGRPTVFEAVGRNNPGLPRVVSVGRLDFNSEGLLLLTNSGALARVLENPKTGWLRRYRVRVNGRVDEQKLAGLAGGTTVSGIHYGPIEAELESRQGANAWLAIGIAEGKNREIRKVMESLGLQVTRLIRVSYGPFVLGNLDRGEVRPVSTKDLHDHIAPIADGIVLPGMETLTRNPKRQGWAKAKPKAKAKHKAKPKAKHRAKPKPAPRDKR